MLVHKATMGVLDRLWTGRHTLGPDGRQVPVERPAVLADVDDPTEWWEIPSQSLLARKIRQYYPLLCPVVDESGHLVMWSSSTPRRTRRPQRRPERRKRPGLRRPPGGATGEPGGCGPWG